jgi:hypothetical protein
VKAAGKQSNPQYLNEHAVKMANDANEAAAEAESNAVRYVYLSLGVVLSGDDAGEVEYRAEYVRSFRSMTSTPGSRISTPSRPGVDSFPATDFRTSAGHR